MALVRMRMDGEIARARGGRSNPAPGRQVISAEGAAHYGLAIGVTIPSGMRKLTVPQREQYDALSPDDRKRYQAERVKGATHPAAMKAAGAKKAPAKKSVEKAAVEAKPAAKTKAQQAAAVEVADAVAKVSAAQSEAEVIALLSGDTRLTSAKLRKVADGLGIDVPPGILQAKSALQLHIAEHFARDRGLPGGWDIDGPSLHRPDQTFIGNVPATHDTVRPAAEKATPAKKSTGSADQVESAKIANALHEDWRKTRKQADGTFEPRVKKTKDQKWIDAHDSDEVDIANTSYDDLPGDWQAENKAAGEVVQRILKQRGGTVDLSDEKTRLEVGEEIHKAWLSRNDWAAGGDLDVPFAELPKDEQDKDTDQIKVAMRALASDAAKPAAPKKVAKAATKAVAPKTTTTPSDSTPRLNAREIAKDMDIDRGVLDEVQARLDDGDSPKSIAAALREEAAGMREGAARLPVASISPRQGTRQGALGRADRYVELADRLDAVGGPPTKASPAKAAPKARESVLGGPMDEAETVLHTKSAAELKRINVALNLPPIPSSARSREARIRHILQSMDAYQARTGGGTDRDRVLQVARETTGDAPSPEEWEEPAHWAVTRQLEADIQSILDNDSPAPSTVATSGELGVSVKAFSGGDGLTKPTQLDLRHALQQGVGSEAGIAALGRAIDEETSRNRGVASPTSKRLEEILHRAVVELPDPNDGRPNKYREAIAAGLGHQAASRYLVSTLPLDEFLKRDAKRSITDPDDVDITRAEYPDENTGAMIALVPSPADLERLAVEGGEDADQLHVTLLFLGKADDYDEDQRAAIIDAARTVADDLEDVLEVDGFSLAMFNPNGDEPCDVLLISGEDLASAHALVEDEIDDLDFDLPDQHTPWHPHITLLYTDDPAELEDLVDLAGPVTLTHIRVAFGDEVTDIPLGEEDETDVEDAAEMGEEPDEEYRSRSFSDTPWSQFTQADYDDEQWRAACLIHDEPAEGQDEYSKELCKLPVREPDGTLNRNGVHAAAGRLSAVDASADQKRSAARKIVSLYREMDEDPPDSLMSMAAMTRAKTPTTPARRTHRRRMTYRSDLTFWTEGDGLNLWATSPTPWAVLQDRLAPDLGELLSAEVATRCVIDVFAS
jgi:2'-5' RNA ligase